MNKNEEAIIALLEKAHREGYIQGCSDTYNNLGVHAVTEEQAESDGMPCHRVSNPIVDAYVASIPADGYKAADVSRMRYFAAWVNEESSMKNQVEHGNPYVVFCDGDTLLLEAEGEPTQKITSQEGVFRCELLMPGKTYMWAVTKNGTLVKRGEFKTVGDIRMIGLETWHNLRDVGGYGLKHGILYSSANPDAVEVGSTDHEVLKHLGIVTQINLRKPSGTSKQNKPWRKDLFQYGYDINIEAYSSIMTKNTTVFKKAVETLAAELVAGHKVLINCYAGADRTGCLRYIIQGVCGMPRKYAQAFYELTSFGNELNTKMWDKEEATGGELRTFDTKLETAFGSDFYTQCYRLLTEVIKVSEQTIKDIQRCLMVDPTKVPTLKNAKA